jgi:hypothetical protein
MANERYSLQIMVHDNVDGETLVREIHSASSLLAVEEDLRGAADRIEKLDTTGEMDPSPHE